METKSKIITTERIGQEQREKLKELIDLYANYEPNLLLWTRYESIGHIGHFSVADHACSSAILFPVSRMGSL